MTKGQLAFLALIATAAIVTSWSIAAVIIHTIINIFY